MGYGSNDGVCGRDRWCTLAVVIDCATREVLGWRLAAQGNAATTERDFGGEIYQDTEGRMPLAASI